MNQPEADKLFVELAGFGAERVEFVEPVVVVVHFEQVS